MDNKGKGAVSLTTVTSNVKCNPNSKSMRIQSAQLQRTKNNDTVYEDCKSQRRLNNKSNTVCESVYDSKNDCVKLERLYKPVHSSSGCTYEKTNIFVVADGELKRSLVSHKANTSTKETQTDKQKVCQETGQTLSYNQSSMNTNSSTSLLRLEIPEELVTRVSAEGEEDGKKQIFTKCHSCAFCYSKNSECSCVIQRRTQSTDVINEHEYQLSCSPESSTDPTANFLIDDNLLPSVGTLITLTNQSRSIDSADNVSVEVLSVPTPSLVSLDNTNTGTKRSVTLLSTSDAHFSASTSSASERSTIFSENSCKDQDLTCAIEMKYERHNICKGSEVFLTSVARAQNGYQQSECGSASTSVPSYSVHGSLWSDPDSNCSWYKQLPKEQTTLQKNTRGHKRINWREVQTNVRDLDTVCLENLIFRRESQVKKAQRKAVNIANLLNVPINTKFSENI